LTKNELYGYRNVSDALIKILRTDSFPGLYRGILTYSMTYIG